MSLGRNVTLRVDGNAARINATLRGARVHPPFHVVDALGDLGACEHLVVEESHIRILMATIRSISCIHSL